MSPEYPGGSFVGWGSPGGDWVALGDRKSPGRQGEAQRGVTARNAPQGPMLPWGFSAGLQVVSLVQG